MTNIKNFILICPDCHSIVDKGTLRCNNCSWRGLFDGEIYYLLPTKLEREKINEDLIHEKVHDPVWRDLLYKKKF